MCVLIAVFVSWGGEGGSKQDLLDVCFGCGDCELAEWEGANWVYRIGFWLW